MQPVRNQEVKYQGILGVINKRCGSDGKHKYYILSVYPPDAITQLPQYELSSGFSYKWMALIVYYISKIWKTTVWDRDIERTVKESQIKLRAYKLIKARKEFLTWFMKEDSTLGEGEYDRLIAEVNTSSKGLPKRKITFHCHCLRFEFHLYYLEELGKEKYIPIERLEGYILKWHVENIPNVFWPLKDPQDNSYFIPEVTMNVIRDSYSESEYIGSYVNRLLNLASDKKNSSYRILEGLINYAKEIQMHCGNSRYKELRKMISSYPDLPDLPEFD